MAKILPMPFAHTIFCEDVRHEINGKSSLHGIYGDTMYLAAEPPLTLRPLFLVLYYYEPRGFCEDPVTFSASLEDSDEPLIEFELLAGGPRLETKEHVIKRPNWKYLGIDTVVNLPSLTVIGDNRLTCYISLGDQQIRASFLDIIFDPQHEMFQKPH